jgi:hypothetical protein
MVFHIIPQIILEDDHSVPGIRMIARVVWTMVLGEEFGAQRQFVTITDKNKNKHMG